MSDFADIVEKGSVRLTRAFPGTVERIWEYLTVPELRKRWLADGPMELRAGGTFTLIFEHRNLRWSSCSNTGASAVPPP